MSITRRDALKLAATALLPQVKPRTRRIIVAGAGIVAGFAYWSIAGWSAGFWKPMFDDPAKENRLSEERR